MSNVLDMNLIIELGKLNYGKDPITTPLMPKNDAQISYYFCQRSLSKASRLGKVSTSNYSRTLIGGKLLDGRSKLELKIV